MDSIGLQTLGPICEEIRDMIGREIGQYSSSHTVTAIVVVVATVLAVLTLLPILTVLAVLTLLSILALLSVLALLSLLSLTLTLSAAAATSAAEAATELPRDQEAVLVPVNGRCLDGSGEAHQGEDEGVELHLGVRYVLGIKLGLLVG